MSGRRTDFAAPTLLDRAIGVFSPSRQLERQKARTALNLLGGSGGYHGGKRTRRQTRNWLPGNNSANADTIGDLPDLRARSRDLVRNTPIATSAINTVATNVVGTGLVLQSQLDRDVLGIGPDEADEIQRHIEREFALACRSLDWTGRQTFDQMQDLVIRSALESGDIFGVRRFEQRDGDAYGLKMLLVEADRCRNKTGQTGSADGRSTMVDGVQLDNRGVPVAYQFWPTHDGDFSGRAGEPKLVNRIGRRGLPLVLHCYTMTRPDQARGVPYLAPVIETIKQLGDYAEAEIRAAVISGMFTAFVIPGAPETGNSPVLGEAVEGESLSADSDREMELASGAIMELEGGDDVKFADPTRPNPNFDAFTVAMCRQIGAALDLPFEVLLKQFTASYSASRAALEMAWQFFRRRRYWLAQSFCQPVFEMAMTEAVARGRIAAPGFMTDPIVRQAWLGAEWIGPSRIQLDPQKEANADRTDIETGVKSRQQVMTERTGGRFDRKQDQIAREHRRRQADGTTAAAPAAIQSTAAPAETEETDDDDA